MARPAVAAALVGLALALWRWGLIGHFEGEFGFGSLEISLAYVGNPGRHAPQGALTLMLKAWMPLAVAAAVFLNEKEGGRGRAALQGAAFVLGARIVHLALATAFNPDSFYTMHRILGELTHEIVLLIGIGLLSFGRTPRPSGARTARSPDGNDLLRISRGRGTFVGSESPKRAHRHHRQLVDGSAGRPAFQRSRRCRPNHAIRDIAVAVAGRSGCELPPRTVYDNEGAHAGCPSSGRGQSDFFDEFASRAR